MSPLILPFMAPQGEPAHVTESYVSVPPALTITDETGAVWTLGFRVATDAPRGEYAFNVLRNGHDTGEYASRIERRGNRVRLFTPQGWKNLKTWHVGHEHVYAFGAKVTQPSAIAEPVSIAVFMSDRVDRPSVEFAFHPRLGGIVYDLSRAPIACAPGQWFFATVRPTPFESITIVMAYLGDRNLREIPIHKGVGP